MDFSETFKIVLVTLQVETTHVYRKVSDNEGKIKKRQCSVRSAEGSPCSLLSNSRQVPRGDFIQVRSVEWLLENSVRCCRSKSQLPTPSPLWPYYTS